MSLHLRVRGHVIGLLLIAAAPSIAVAQISPEMQAQARALAQVCRGDFERLCAAVQPGGGRILVCLQRRAAELTPRCRDAMPKAEALKAKAEREGVLPK